MQKGVYQMFTTEMKAALEPRKKKTLSEEETVTTRKRVWKVRKEKGVFLLGGRDFKNLKVEN